jgi:GH15 family glucan-1,4-alpha-glucosidase
MSAARIEDYALIGDCETAALVGRDGAMDWLCWPRFDSPACFAALLGDAANGRWRIAPKAEVRRTSRRYRPDTLVLETDVETDAGAVTLVDFMPLRGEASDVVRLVQGRRGRVAMAMQLIVRFDYGARTPWVTRRDGALHAIAGPDLVVLRTPAPLRGQAMTTVSDFTVAAGETVPFVLSYGPSHKPAPGAIDPFAALEETEAFWRRWRATSAAHGGPYAELVGRALITLKALTHAPTGGIVAAPTTSLPEQFGGARNWDYRYCWIRDATWLLMALMDAGHVAEAKAWIDWLHRAVAGRPADMQIMYGVTGEARLIEWEPAWLSGYQGARPVRIGNAAHSQFQLDVYGELMDATHHARVNGLTGADTWALQRQIMRHVEAVWPEPDEGIWEVRGGRRHFTFSKMMAWVAMDRAIQSAEMFGLDGPVETWRRLRATIHEQVCARGVNPATGGFQRAYDDPTADASLLLAAELGFVTADDPRFVATVTAVERELVTADGFVMRYDSHRVDDGLPPGEGAFLACSFWLANAYVMLGRHEAAHALFERLVGFANDVGLLAEEYDPAGQRLAGNFPQALSTSGFSGLRSTSPAPPSPARCAPTWGRSRRPGARRLIGPPNRRRGARRRAAWPCGSCPRTGGRGGDPGSG